MHGRRGLPAFLAFLVLLFSTSQVAAQAAEPIIIGRTVAAGVGRTFSYNEMLTLSGGTAVRTGVSLGTRMLYGGGAILAGGALVAALNYFYKTLKLQTGTTMDQWNTKEFSTTFSALRESAYYVTPGVYRCVNGSGNMMTKQEAMDECVSRAHTAYASQPFTSYRWQAIGTGENPSQLDLFITPDPQDLTAFLNSHPGAVSGANTALHRWADDQSHGTAINPIPYLTLDPTPTPTQANDDPCYDRVSDTDGDSYPDCLESGTGSNPNSPTSVPNVPNRNPDGTCKPGWMPGSYGACDVAATVTGTTTYTNPDGSVTTKTTYSDGSFKTHTTNTTTTTTTNPDGSTTKTTTNTATDQRYDSRGNPYGPADTVTTSNGTRRTVLTTTSNTTNPDGSTTKTTTTTTTDQPLDQGGNPSGSPTSSSRGEAVTVSRSSNTVDNPDGSKTTTTTTTTTTQPMENGQPAGQPTTTTTTDKANTPAPTIDPNPPTNPNPDPRPDPKPDAPPGSVSYQCGDFSIPRLLAQPGSYLYDVVFPCKPLSDYISPLVASAKTKFPFSITDNLSHMVTYGGSGTASDVLPSKLGPFTIDWAWIAPLIAMTGLLFKSFTTWIVIDIILTRLSGQVVIK